MASHVELRQIRARHCSCDFTATQPSSSLYGDDGSTTEHHRDARAPDVVEHIRRREEEAHVLPPNAIAHGNASQRLEPSPSSQIEPLSESLRRQKRMAIKMKWTRFWYPVLSDAEGKLRQRS